MDESLLRRQVRELIENLLRERPEVLLRMRKEMDALDPDDPESVRRRKWISALVASAEQLRYVDDSGSEAK